MARITIDPITRIEGHLRIDVEVDGGKVTNAWASGQMWRGIENILLGRDPRDAWAFTQRFCGVCTTVHAIASVRTVENALGLEIPLNAQYIRNLMMIAHAVHDHIVHFYHLSALDWVDVVSALQGDPRGASALAESLSPWPNNGRAQIQATKDRLAGFVAAGQLGIYAQRVLGPPGDEAAARREPPGGAPLPAGARGPEEGQPGGHDPRQQDPERADHRRRRRHQRDQPRLPGHAQHGPAVHRQEPARRGGRLRAAGARAGRVRDRRDVPRVARLRQGRHELPRRPRPSDRHQGHAVRPARRDDHGGRLLDVQGDQELRRPLFQGQRRGVDRALLVRRRLAEAPVRGDDRPEVHEIRRRRRSTPG